MTETVHCHGSLTSHKTYEPAFVVHDGQGISHDLVWVPVICRQSMASIAMHQQVRA